MAEDTVRVIRIVVYEGPRKRVEETVARAIHGTKDAGRCLWITATTLGDFAEIMEIAAHDSEYVEPMCARCRHAKGKHGDQLRAIDELCSCCAVAENFA